MNVEYFTTRMARNAVAIDEIVRMVDVTQATWRPSPEKWSILEVICHLYDEERFDFRERVRRTLEDPQQPWEPIDPVGWVKERRYNEQDLEEMRSLWKVERGESIAWLSSLADVDWSRAHTHPQLRVMTAGSLLGSWLAHDYLHIRQLSGLHYQYLAGFVAPHRLDYAGGWQ